MHRDAPSTLLHEAVATAVTPVQRGEIALSGARALGLVGHFDDAFALCRARARGRPARIPPNCASGSRPS